MAAQREADTLEERGGALGFVPFTRTPNAYYEQVLGVVSVEAWALLSYVLRHTSGYQRDAVALSDAELMTGKRSPDGGVMDHGAGLAERTLRRAKAELKAAKLVAITDGRGRSRVPTYALLPASEWELDTKPASVAAFSESGTRPGNKPTHKPASVAAFQSKSVKPATLAALPATLAAFSENAQKDEESAGRMAPSAAAPSSVRSPTIPERNIKKGDAERSTSVRAPRASSSTPGTHSTTRAPLKEADPRATYTRELVVTLEAQHGAKLPSYGREMRAASWYWTAGKGGAPAAIEDVMECRRVALLDPWWQDKYMGLDALKAKWSLWVAKGPQALQPAKPAQAPATARSGYRTAAAPPVKDTIWLTPDAASAWVD